MTWLLYILFSFLVLNCSVFANDTLQKGKVFPVVIKESLKMDVKGMYYLPISFITKEMFQIIRPQQIDEVLSIVPGIFIQNYGGLGGMKSLSIRGTSSSQSVVMLEGIRMNSAQNGMIDLSTIPVSFLESIEVTRTGASALYGANAVGGAINLRISKEKIPNSSFTLERSSFDTYTANGTFGVGFDNGYISTSLSTVNSRGNYPFLHNEFGSTTIVQRDNGDFTQHSGIVQGSFSPSLQSTISSVVIVTDSDRGVPGAVVQGSVEFKNARLSERNYFGAIFYKQSVNESLSISSSIWSRNNSFLYTDPEATLLGPNGIRTQYTAFDLGTKSTIEKAFLNGSSIQTELELLTTNLVGFSLQDASNIQPSRNSVSFSVQYSSTEYLLLRIPFMVFSGLRFDYISDQNNAVSPLVSIQLPISTEFKIRTSYSYNYRAPSFNELYYLNYGNKNLVSERSHSLTVGVESLLNKYFSSSIDFFSLRTSNLILSIPNSPVSWSAQNIGTVNNYGIEFSSKMSPIPSILTLSTSLTYQNVVDITENSLTNGLRVPYTPNFVFSNFITYSVDEFVLGITYTLTGNRFSLQGNQVESLLPNFQTVSNFVEFKTSLFPLLIHYRFQSDNLLNSSYTIIRNFPVPGRSFRFNIGVTWL